MMKIALSGSLLLAILPFAAAHGYLRQIAIDGKIYRGNIPNVSNFPSPIRLISDIIPVKGAHNRSVNCGLNAKPAALVVDANPGSKLTFDWAGGDNGRWPHNTGPMMTYLAQCGNTTCDKFDPINAKWFKIDEVGKKNNSATWFQQDIMNGDTYSTHLPNNLAPGQYMVRHEIIGLHIANSPGGAEFYPSCTQITVSGNQTGVPGSNDTVALPGAYSDTEPGILGNTFFDPGPYDFPGPAINPNLASGSVAITDPAPSTNGLPDPTLPASSAAPSATGQSNLSGSDDDDDDDSDCDDMDDSSSMPSATASANNAISSATSDSDSYNYLPRQVSRVMRRAYGNI